MRSSWCQFLERGCLQDNTVTTISYFLWSVLFQTFYNLAFCFSKLYSIKVHCAQLDLGAYISLDKEVYSFFKFDMFDFYPSISEELVRKSLKVKLTFPPKTFLKFS